MTYEMYSDVWTQEEFEDLQEWMEAENIHEEALRLRAKMENLRVARELGFDSGEAVLMGLKARIEAGEESA